MGRDFDVSLVFLSFCFLWWPPAFKVSPKLILDQELFIILLRFLKWRCY